MPFKSTRRTFLAQAGAAAIGFSATAALTSQPTRNNNPISGIANPELSPFDQLMTSFIEENKVPGASLAVTRFGKLIYARGFGLAEVHTKEIVEPGSLFRIASVSKPITAVAVLQLIQKGKLKFDDKIVERMKLTALETPKTKFDERWKRITIRQCLQHTGGWDRDKSYDPIVRPWQIAKAFDIDAPPTPAQIVRYMMGEPLDFDPGERMAYSNLGYLVLGRIIEEITGQTYEEHVKKDVLAPLGIKNMQLGRALIDNRAKGEVKYYDSKKRMGRCLYAPQRGQQVSAPDGAENLEGFEAHGGWIASSIDLVRFASAFDESGKSPLLNAKSIAEMFACPPGSAGKDKDGKASDAFYGCGWNVRPVGHTGKSNTWHSGYISGSEALLVRRFDGLNWAVLFNTADNPAGKKLNGRIDGRIHEAADKVKRWPDDDQFAKYLK